jgi:hypothetical protein
LACLAVAFAFACGVEDRKLSTGLGAAGSGDLDVAVARFSLAACDRIQKCDPTYIRAAHGTYDRCVERTKLLNAWIAGLPGVLQTADFFTECAAAWNNLPCGEIFSPFPIAACKQFGSLAAGDGCNFGDQCASGFCKQTGFQCGVCADQPAQGSSCQVDDDCGEAQWCMPDKKCRTPSGMNEQCTDTQRCRLDLSCSGAVCVASPASPGAPCDGANGLTCDFYSKGLYCTNAKTCAEASAKATNESCAEVGSYCEKNGACTNGTCVPHPADNGGACDNDSGLYCEWPARCVDASCQLPTSVTLCAHP